MHGFKALLPVIAGLGLFAPSAESAWTSDKKLTVYHTNWATYGRNYQVADLPIDYISDVAYAFFNIGSDGTVSSGDTWADYQKRFTGGDAVLPYDTWQNDDQGVWGTFGQFMKLKQNGKAFNFTISIGGWTWSARFSQAVSTDANRRTFSHALVTMMQQYSIIQGVSIDWEYLSNDGVNYGNGGNAVSKDDDNNFVLFVQQLRSDMNAAGFTDRIISACSTAAPEKMKFNAAKWGEVIDELHVMTYDFSDGSWGDAVASHQSNLYPTSYTPYSVSAAVDAYIKAGFPAKKIMIGAAAYSRGFSNTAGIGKASSGGSPDMSWEIGVADYKTLPRAGATEYWDSAAQAGYSYDPVKKVLDSYDTVQAVVAKCEYVKSKGLLGIIMWESSGDATVDSGRSLIKAIYDCFHADESGAPAPAPAPAPATPTTVIVPDNDAVTTPGADATTTPADAATTTAAQQATTTADQAATSVPAAATTTPAAGATTTPASAATTTPASAATTIASAVAAPSHVTGSPPPASAHLCTPGYYECYPAVNQAAFRVCDTSKKWVVMGCAPGTKCVQNAQAIYCDWA